jgi:hypothetical protein
MPNKAQETGNRFWLLIGNIPNGPFDIAQIHAQLVAGDITWETQACAVGGSTWLPLVKTAGVGPRVPSMNLPPAETAQTSGSGVPFKGPALASSAIGRSLEMQRAEMHVGNRQMIAQLRTDTRDQIPMLAETLRVLVRLNPVNISIHNFWSFINTITEATPPSEIAGIVGQAIGQVDLSNVVAYWDELQEVTTNFSREIVLHTPRKLAEVWPSYMDFVPNHPWLANLDREAEMAADQIRRALSMYRSDLGVIQNHFHQLSEYYPRYASIMTRTGVLDYVLGFAAGFFGGFLGAVGAQVWDDWRTQSDRDFVESFSNAVNQFTNSAVLFMQNTESAVNAVADQLLRSYADLDERFATGLEIAAAKGMNVTRVYRSLHDPDQLNHDPDSKRLFEIVFDNLRQQGYSRSSESNMRYVMGLS